jgi:hypothetical protein
MFYFKSSSNSNFDEDKSITIIISNHSFLILLNALKTVDEINGSRKKVKCVKFYLKTALIRTEKNRKIRTY